MYSGQVSPCKRKDQLRYSPRDCSSSTKNQHCKQLRYYPISKHLFIHRELKSIPILIIRIILLLILIRILLLLIYDIYTYRLEQWLEYVTRVQLPPICSSRRRDSSTYTLPSSPPLIARVLEKCFRYIYIYLVLIIDDRINHNIYIGSSYFLTYAQFMVSDWIIEMIYRFRNLCNILILSSIYLSSVSQSIDPVFFFFLLFSSLSILV